MTASAASGQSGQPEVRPSFPEPPVWYTKFVDGYEGKPPPVPYGVTIFPFSCPLKIEERGDPQNIPLFLEDVGEVLDSDTKMFQLGPDRGLREEFGRLFELLVEQVQEVIKSMARAGQDGVGKSTDTLIKTMEKTYKNLTHILFALRQWQAADLIVDKLKRQLENRQRLISRLEAALSPEKQVNERWAERCSLTAELDRLILDDNEKENRVGQQSVASFSEHGITPTRSEGIVPARMYPRMIDRVPDSFFASERDLSGRSPVSEMSETSEVSEMSEVSEVCEVNEVNESGELNE
eukprot:GHVN01027602.1.p1 GENE.GHVN01027602.1~~GHVN01027602.1.p1  ORF type:complete len:294 (-),score=73.35 GHVN01027602.1:17-898(-)